MPIRRDMSDRWIRSTMRHIIPRRGLFDLQSAERNLGLIIKRQYSIGCADVDANVRSSALVSIYILDSAARCAAPVTRNRGYQGKSISRANCFDCGCLPARESRQCVSSRDRIRAPVHVAIAHVHARTTCTYTFYLSRLRLTQPVSPHRHTLATLVYSREYVHTGREFEIRREIEILVITWINDGWRGFPLFLLGISFYSVR